MLLFFKYLITFIIFSTVLFVSVIPELVIDDENLLLILS